VALGLADPTQTSETRYESRLFNQTSGFGTGFNEDRAYDKPLFAAQHTINSIYRPQVKGHDGADEEDTGGSDLDRLRKAPRLEYLGKAAKEFSGVAEAEARDGPVQFEKVDMSDPFNIGEMLEEARGDGRGGKEGSDGAKRVRRAGAGGPSIGKT
jgi:SNW domain-containing protein 1